MLPKVPFYSRFPFQINVQFKLFSTLSNSVLTTKPNPFFKFISLIRPKPRKNFSTSLSLASLGNRPRNTLGALSLLMIFVTNCKETKGHSNHHSKMVDKWRARMLSHEALLLIAHDVAHYQSLWSRAPGKEKLASKSCWFALWKNILYVTMVEKHKDLLEWAT